MSQRSPLRVVGALCVRGEDILLTRRPPGGPRGGIWEFPGGKVDPGEGDEDALARELMEEIALPVEVRQRVSDETHDYGDLEVHLLVYLCHPLGGAEPKLVEAAEIAWVRPGDFHHFDLQGADATLGAALDRLGLGAVQSGAVLAGAALDSE